MFRQDEKSVEKFLEPSFKYLVENGLENTSVRDLCRAMDISYGNLYYWFDGKDDIFTTVAEYGVTKVADKLFKFAFDKMRVPEEFFNTFLEEVDKYKKELRLVFQVATSPVYGQRIREKSLAFREVYNEYTERLASILGCKIEEMMPVVYTLISILVNYVTWGNYEWSKKQLDFLYKIVSTELASK